MSELNLIVGNPAAVRELVSVWGKIHIIGISRIQYAEKKKMVVFPFNIYFSNPF